LLFRHLTTPLAAGTAAYHVGDEPDSRTVKVCRKNLGTSMPNIDDIRGRQVHRSDFDKFELVLCMDKSNLHDVREPSSRYLATSIACASSRDRHAQLHSIRPAGSKAEVRLLGSFDPQGESIIEDPYYGGIDGFQHNFQQVMRCCNEILDQYQ